jgi:hypothetical protein
VWLKKDKKSCKKFWRLEKNILSLYQQKGIQKNKFNNLNKAVRSGAKL